MGSTRLTRPAPRPEHDRLGRGHEVNPARTDHLGPNDVPGPEHRTIHLIDRPGTPEAG